jgi:hypothetical protein
MAWICSLGRANSSSSVYPSNRTSDLPLMRNLLMIIL